MALKAVALVRALNPWVRCAFGNVSLIMQVMFNMDSTSDGGALLNKGPARVNFQQGRDIKCQQGC